jgi:hypothetical protein
MVSDVGKVGYPYRPAGGVPSGRNLRVFNDLDLTLITRAIQSYYRKEAPGKSPVWKRILKSTGNKSNIIDSLIVLTSRG